MKPRSAKAKGRKPGNRLIDLTGQRFERLTVLERNGNTPNREVRWLCRCVCGQETTVTGGELRRNGVQSCGCLSKDVHTTHGLAPRKNPHPMYRAWATMWTRCTNPKIPCYKYYGGRGVKVCERWKDFTKFLDDMGERPEGMTLDRIDNDGGYTPDNCRWATYREQMLNSRATKLTPDKVRRIKTKHFPYRSNATIGRWYGVSRQMISRIRRGKSWAWVE